MSEQVEINENLKKYLQEFGYRKDTLVDELASETRKLGNVARMQIAKEQGQFLEIIVKISNAKSCLEIGTVYRIKHFIYGSRTSQRWQNSNCGYVR